MLIEMPRHTDEDLAWWHKVYLPRIRRIAVTTDWRARIERIRCDGDAWIKEHEGRCYVGMSWGKDSVAAAHIVRLLWPGFPLVRVCLPRWDNPDCDIVRDRFGEWPGEYREIIADPTGPDPVDGYLPTGSRGDGYGVAAKLFGAAYISGIRMEESADRKRRGIMAWKATGHVETTRNTYAPITRWTGDEVLAFALWANLPIHPAYGCTYGGRREPGRLRVASLGGLRGGQWQRREWEMAYYSMELVAAITGRPRPTPMQPLG